MLAGPESLALLCVQHVGTQDDLFCDLPWHWDWQACSSLYPPSSLFCRCTSCVITSGSCDFPSSPGLQVGDGGGFREHFCHLLWYPWVDSIWPHGPVHVCTAGSEHFPLDSESFILPPVSVSQHRGWVPGEQVVAGIFIWHAFLHFHETDIHAAYQK